MQRYSLQDAFNDLNEIDESFASNKRIFYTESQYELKNFILGREDAVRCIYEPKSGYYAASCAGADLPHEMIYQFANDEGMFDIGYTGKAYWDKNGWEHFDADVLSLWIIKRDPAKAVKDQSMNGVDGYIKEIVFNDVIVDIRALKPNDDAKLNAIIDGCPLLKLFGEPLEKNEFKLKNSGSAAIDKAWARIGFGKDRRSFGESMSELESLSYGDDYDEEDEERMMRKANKEFPVGYPAEKLSCKIISNYGDGRIGYTIADKNGKELFSHYDRTLDDAQELAYELYKTLRRRVAYKIGLREDNLALYDLVVTECKAGAPTKIQFSVKLDSTYGVYLIHRNVYWRCEAKISVESTHDWRYGYPFYIKLDYDNLVVNEFILRPQNNR